MRNKYNKKDCKLPYALNSNNELVSIQKIKDSGLRGLSCNCRCPKCKDPLEARIGKAIRAPYFAHSKHSNCRGAIMTILHMRSRDLIEKHKVVMAPNYYSIPPRKLEFLKVEVEKRGDRNDMQPDIVGITADGKRWAIEIRNTHEVGEEKRKKIIESDIACLEIDVRKQSIEKLEDFLFNETYSREWIHNPYDEELLPKEKLSVNNSSLIDKKENYNYTNTGVIHVPDYIYNPRKERVIRDNNYDLKIPDSCHDLSDYYLYLSSRNNFFYKGRRHKIIKLAFSPECEQLIIIHYDNLIFSYRYLTCVFLDSDGNVLYSTVDCDLNNTSLFLDAIRKDWGKKVKELKENEGLPFPRRNDNKLPF